MNQKKKGFSTREGKKTIHSTQWKKNGYFCLVWFYNSFNTYKRNTITHLLKNNYL